MAGIVGSFDSTTYWESRYDSGGNSGAGSSGRLATFKAGFLNAFVRDNAIGSVIEFGTGDGQQLKLFKFPRYIGIDISKKVIEESRKRYADSPQHSFLHSNEIALAEECDLSLSLDVVFHLVQDDVFERYMRDVFFFGKRYIIIYSSDVDADWNAQHVRHRNFTKFVATRFPEWTLIARVMNTYPFDAGSPADTSFCDFFVFGKSGAPCVLTIPSADRHSDA
jgi:hypothetical protein